jgi:hypothetical protein
MLTLGTQKASRGVYIEYPAPFFRAHVYSVLTSDNSCKAEKVVHGAYHRISDRASYLEQGILTAE